MTTTINHDWPDSLFYLTTDDNMASQYPKVIRALELTRAGVEAEWIESNATVLDDILVGLSLGDDDERHKVRLFREKGTSKVKIQKNTGTDSTPVWEDLFEIDETSGDAKFYAGITTGRGPFIAKGGITLGANLDMNDYSITNLDTINSQDFQTIARVDEYGGVKVFTNVDRLRVDKGVGFYLYETSEGDPVITANERLFGKRYVFHQSFYATEWVANHGLNTTNVIVQARSETGTVLSPTRIDLSNPNTAYFYFGYTTRGEAGDAVIASGGLGAASVLSKLQITDGTNTHLSQELNVNDSVFYLSTDLNGDPVLNVRESGFVIDHGALNGRDDDDHSIYTLADGSRDFTGNQSMGGFKLTNLAAPSSNADAARLQDVRESFGFYGIQIRESESGGASFKTRGGFAVDSNYFYLQTGGDSRPVISLHEDNIDHGTLSGNSDDDHTQYTRADGTRAFTGNQSMGSNKLTSLAAGSSATDAVQKQQVVLVDGSQDFTGDQSMGGNKLTSVGAPTSDDDAARLQDIGPGFYGINVGTTSGSEAYKGINTIKFSEDFYITRNADASDEATVNFRNLPTSLDELDDVSASNPSDNQILTFDATSAKWINEAASTGVTKQTFSTPAYEWQVTHNHNSDSIVAMAYDDLGNFMVPSTLDVSDPNTAYFYFAELEAGFAVIAGSVSGSGGEVNTASSLGDVDVYKEKSGTELRFRGLTAGNGISLSAGATDITVTAEVTQTELDAVEAKIGEAFYGVTFRESESGGFAKKSDAVTFDSNYFYIASDGSDEPVVSLHENNIDHDKLTNFSTSEHFTEASIDHTNIQTIGTNTHAQIDTHIADTTIHFTEASIDHGSIDGLTDDDHTQYALVDGTRAFTAHQEFNDTIRIANAATAEAFYLTSGGDLAYDSISAHIETPTDKAYTLDEYAFQPYTILKCIHKTSAGTATGALAIDGSTITGLNAMSHSSSQTISTATASNVMSAGSRLTLTISSASSIADLAFTIFVARG